MSALFLHSSSIKKPQLVDNTLYPKCTPRLGSVLKHWPLQTMVSGYLKRAVKLCLWWYKHGKDFIILFFFTLSFLGHIWCQQLGEWGCFASTSSQHRSRWIWLLWLRFHLWLLRKKSTSCTRSACCYVESAPHHFVFEENFKCKINVIYSLLVCMFSLN